MSQGWGVTQGGGFSEEERGVKGGRICKGGCREQNAKRIKVNKLLRKKSPTNISA